MTPDEIYLNIIITEKDTKGRTSVEELESKMEAKLKEIGVDTRNDLTLNDLSSNFKKYFLKQQDILKSKLYSVKTYDAVTAGRIIVELENIGISNVSLDRTEFSKIEQLRFTLRSKAVLKAKKQATYMVEPLNQKVGAAIYISDLTENFTYQLQGRVAGVSIRGYSSNKKFESADIEFEKIPVETTLNVRFKLEE